ncbi:MAG: histidinol-phosphate transaminase [Parvibaculaceae bacterium]
MITPCAYVAAMDAYALADLGGQEKPTLAQNESVFPPSPRTKSAALAALERAALYPDPDWQALRDLIAATHGITRDLILCGAGSMDLIDAVIRAFAGPEDEVLAPAYSYLFAASAAARANARYVTVPEVDFRVSVENLLAGVTARTRVVFVCNPANPTGTRIPNGDLMRLRRELREDILLVIDQAYGEFDDQDQAPIFALAERGDTVILRTFSKAYGLAGQRIGWGIFPKAIGAQVRKLQNSNNVTIVGLAMAAAAVADQPHMRRIVSRTSLIRDRCRARLMEAGFPVPESHTNFLMIPFADQAAARRADAALKQAGFIMRGLAGYGLAHCLRATIAPDEVMQRVLGILVPAAPRLI